MRKIFGMFLLLFGLCVSGADNDRGRIDNAGFEQVKDGKPAQWGFFAREREKAGYSVVEDAGAGRYAARIVNSGDRDWALYNERQTAVRPGECFEIGCRMKSLGGGKSGALKAVGLAGKKLVSWEIGTTASVRDGEWREYRGFLQIPEGVDTIYLRFVGEGETDLLVDDVSIAARDSMRFPEGGPKVDGWAKKRTYEKMGRGVVALECDDGIYIGWRLLKSDDPEIGFDVYRESNGVRVKCNPAPVVRTTDYIDTQNRDLSAFYSVEPASGFAGISGRSGVVGAAEKTESFLTIPISDTEAKSHKVAIADLDGDGVYDYVVKHPGGNIDPWHKYWKPSEETYKIEGRRADGGMLWKIDLGWNIERGTWYSPIIAEDLDGDGRAEVAAKIGPDKDMRDKDGKVQSGEEWVGVFDGMSGREIARAPWPSRAAFDSYNHASRNQIAVAWLDGRTPCLITLRGTYGVMLADAWMLQDGALKKLWSYSNVDLWGPVRGQGAHSCLCYDVDQDGRDEVILGSVVLDDNGAVLWSTGKGHPDAHYLGDIDPLRPGMEIAYVIETRQLREGGLNLVDAKTGKFLWQLQAPTVHVHSRGICSDIDCMHMGMEIYGADADNHKLTEKRWLLTAGGAVIRSGMDVDFSFGVPCAWWDADLQRELIRGEALDYEGGSVSRSISGSIMQVADVIGDWREEVICTESGEVRIYTTRIPAMDRRVCLMQDDAYRMRVRMNAMGYEQTPTLSYLPAAESLNVNLTVVKEDGKEICRAVIQAPLDRGYKGEVELRPLPGRKIEQKTLAVDLKPGEMIVKKFKLQ